VWNSITSTNTKRVERIQRRFADRCFNRYFPPPPYYNYAYASEYLTLHTSRTRRYHLDALFLTEAYLCSKYFPFRFEAVDLRFPTRYIRDFSLFDVCYSSKNCPAGFTSVDGIICMKSNIFVTKTVSLESQFRV
jgi:hypothetical protein